MLLPCTTTNDNPTTLDAVVTAWRNAATDLGIRVVAPFELLTDSGTTAFPLFLPVFGRPAGMVCCVRGVPLGEPAAAEQVGHYCSILYPQAYSRYDRKRFIDTLNDWQYFGPPESRPAWYTGEPWSDPDRKT